MAQELLLKCSGISLSQGIKLHIVILSSFPKDVTSVHPAEPTHHVRDVDQTPKMVAALSSPSRAGVPA